MIFQTLNLIKNNMKKHYQIECSLQQKTYQLHKLTQQEQRISKITQKFAYINKNLLQKTHLQTTNTHQNVAAVSKLSAIEQKIDVSMMRSQQNLAKYKDRLQSVKQSQGKMETSFRQKLINNKLKLNKMKLKFNTHLFEGKYRHQQMILEVQQEFQKFIQKTYQNKYLFDQKILQKNTIKLLNKLNGGIQELKNISQSLELQEQKSKQEVITELQAKLAELKQKLKKNEALHLQTLNNVNGKIELMKEQFETELIEERAIREQNKQKLLTLLETNLANYLDKSLK